MSKIKIPYICGLIFIILCTVFYLYTSKNKPIHQQCPDEYADTDAGSAQYLADFDKWTNDFYGTYPGATLSDWSNARYKFWVDNNCTSSIQSYNEAKDGKADPVIMNKIKDSIQESINKSTQ